jgi:hypothetical protein
LTIRRLPSPTLSGVPTEYMGSYFSSQWHKRSLFFYFWLVPILYRTDNYDRQGIYRQSTSLNFVLVFN